jgi:hypothetical protein
MLSQIDVSKAIIGAFFKYFLQFIRLNFVVGLVSCLEKTSVKILWIHLQTLCVKCFGCLIVIE